MTPPRIDIKGQYEVVFALKIAYVSVLCLLLLVGCASPPAEIQVSLSFLHLPSHSATVVCNEAVWRLESGGDASTPFPVYALVVGDRNVYCDYDLRVFDQTTGAHLPLSPEATAILGSLRNELHTAVFAPPVVWEDANKSFSRLAIGEVLDLSSGRTFRVQRRGGTYHADVQPITREDTAIMKEIYGGQWSWDRRAVIVQVGDTRMAASMNGMPHGQGALQNNFPGHSCIHFAGSTTHGSRDMDLGHMLMVAKAAGTIWETAREATPEQQMHNFIAAFNQKDLWLTSQFCHPDSLHYVVDAFQTIQTINLQVVTLAGPAQDICELDVSMEVVFTGGSGRRQTVRVPVKVLSDRWVVDAAFLGR